MGQLGAKDLEEAFGFLREAQAIDGLQAFVDELVPSLRRLVACETLGYNEIDLDPGTAVGVSGAPVFLSIRTFHGLEDQLGPHLALAYSRAREHERIRTLIQALDAELEDRHGALIQLDPHGRPAHVSSAAQELLDAYFTSRRHSENALPEPLRVCLGAADPNGAHRELTIEGPRGRLQVREQRAGPAGGWRILILKEHRVSPPSIEALRELGLTARQAQVLRLLACGKTSRQVAAELQISTATVSKHLEHIYHHLGVNTRAQALAQIYA